MEDEEQRPNPRAAASMAAFDAMPERWRRFCALYPRTGSGAQLADILTSCRNDVAAAEVELMTIAPVSLPRERW